MAWQLWNKKERRPCTAEEMVQDLKDLAKYPAHRKTARYLLDQIGSQTANKAKK